MQKQGKEKIQNQVQLILELGQYMALEEKPVTKKGAGKSSEVIVRFCALI